MRKVKLHAAFLILALTLAMAGTAGAWSWHTFNGSQYSLTDTAGSWTAAEAEAVLAGGHLVTINDLAEQNHLLSAYGTSFLWIGFTDQAQEGTWKWISGQPVTYTNWDEGNPSPGAPYAVIAMYQPWGGTWINYPEYFILDGIIERSAVPLPSALLLLSSGLAGLAAWRRRRG